MESDSNPRTNPRGNPPKGNESKKQKKEAYYQLGLGSKDLRDNIRYLVFDVVRLGNFNGGRQLVPRRDNAFLHRFFGRFV